MGTLHEDQFTFLITSRSVLLTMRNVLEKCCTGNLHTGSASESGDFYMLKKLKVLDIMIRLHL